MRTTLLASLLALILLLTSYTPSIFASESLTLFSTQASAQQHCINDEVVWLNTSSHIWHSQGGRWFGNTKNGSYVCKNEAAATGNRASLNG